MRRGGGAAGASYLFIEPSSTIYSGQTVVVSYDKSEAGTDAIADGAGNEMGDFTTGSGGVPAVRNDSTATPASTDATLSGLTVTAGGSDLVTFASGTTSYTASVANTVAEVTVTPTNDSGATFEYLNASDMALADADTAAGHQVTLVDGDNVIKVKVTAEDGSSTLTYTVTVKRAVLAVSAVFGAARYDVTEGESVTVTVNLSEAPGRALTIPLTRENGDGVNDADLTGVPPSVTFAATAMSASFTVMATDNDVYNGGKGEVCVSRSVPSA